MSRCDIENGNFHPLDMAQRLIFLFFLAAMAGCQRNKSDVPDRIDPAFSAYISAFTSHIISNADAIRIRFTQSISSAGESGSQVSQDWISFDPPISGALVWADERTLVFEPEGLLPSNQPYDCRLKLGEITDVPEALELFAFQFRTMAQSVAVSVNSIQPYTSSGLRWNRLDGTVETRDQVSSDDLEQTLELALESKACLVHWSHEPNGLVHRFWADSLERTEVEQVIRIGLDGAVVGAAQREEVIDFLPALGDFKVMAPRVVQQPDQYVVIRCSDPLDPDQRVQDFIRFPGRNLSFTTRITGNEIHVFPEGRLSGQVNISIASSLRNILGYRLKEPVALDVEFEALKPAVKFTDTDKVIVPSTNGMAVPFEAVNLSAVDVTVYRIFETNIPQFLQNNGLSGGYQMRRVGRKIRRKTIGLNEQSGRNLGTWNTFFLNLSDLIRTEPGAIYRVVLGFRPNHSLYPCAQALVSDSDEFVHWDDDGDETAAFWSDDEDYYTYDYDWRERDNPCDMTYFRSRRYDQVSRNMLASDVGVIAKQDAQGAVTAFVTDLITAKPRSGAQVEILDYQQQVMATATTDGNGRVHFDQFPRDPFLLTASVGKERAFQRLDHGTSRSVSTFDVGGKTVTEGLKGFLYGERGVWRPGDTLFLNFILEDRQGLLENQHPIQFELVDVRGQRVVKERTTRNVNGVYSFTVPTSPDAPTGSWHAKVRVGGAVFSKNIPVETVKPNRLKVEVDFDKSRILAGQGDLEGQLRARWLHGAPARNLKARVQSKFVPIPTRFDGFDEYGFDDPSRTFHMDEHTLFEGNLNEEGTAEVALSATLDTPPPGMLMAQFFSRVFEPGGDFSTDQFSIPYAPYEGFVGHRLPKGDAHDILYTDTPLNLDIVTLSAEGKGIARSGVEVEVYKLEWRWWWERRNRLSNYTQSAGAIPAISGTVNTGSNGKGTFAFEVGESDWGRYFVRTKDPVSGHCSGSVVYIDWPGWASRTDRGSSDGAAMLVLGTDKDTYAPGEVCTVTFPSSTDGRALVSLETGAQLLRDEWVECSAGQTRYAFTVTEEMAPNCYVAITLLQPHQQTENDLPIRMYGIAPIRIEDPETRLLPEVSLPEVIRPEETFALTVAESNDRPMTYTVAIVDEGLLDLTRFKTPQPWDEFYAREALGVRTWDGYDRVAGAYAAPMDALLSLGGDGTGVDPSAARAMRFKPVVVHLGPFELKPGQKRKHQIAMPNYVGAVRTMVVAREGTAYGSCEATTPVKNPLMVLATLPRVCGPGEQIALPVNVFAMEEGVRDVEVSIETNGMFRAEKRRQSVRFEAIGDQVVYFELDAANALGVGEVSIVATSGGHRASQVIELDVRNPNPEQTDVTSVEVQPGESWDFQLTPLGMEGTNAAYLEVSTIPAIDFNRRVNYLIGYPHGCLEQTTSRAFPQLYLDDIVELNAVQRGRISQHIQAAIQTIKRYQHSSGGLSYWPGGHNTNDWSSSYAGHFLLEAKDSGYAVPESLLKQWVRYQQKSARNWESGTSERSWKRQRAELVQAYRLYTLALAGAPDLSAMNRLRELEGLSSNAQWRLAAAYAMSGQAPVAREMVARLTTVPANGPADPYTYGDTNRDRALILETLALLDDQERAAPVAREIAKALNGDRWYSTQSTAFALIAMAKFIGDNRPDGTLRFSYRALGQPQEVVTEKSMASVPLDAQDSAYDFHLDNTSGRVLFVRLVRSGIPARAEESAGNNDLDVQVAYVDMNGAPLDVSKLEQGTDFKARVTVRHPGVRDAYQDMALTQIFPSGWEILNQRMGALGEEANGGSRVDHVDVRDDRVLHYFNLRPRESLTVEILLNASYQGEFYLPAVHCSAMYDNTIYARTAGRTVEVVANNRSVSVR